MSKYAIAAILIIFQTSPTLAKIQIRLHWTVVEVEVQPKSAMHIGHGSSSYLIDGDNIQTISGRASAHLGGSASGVNDNNNEYTVSYRISGGIIHIQRNFDGLVEYEAITTDGATSCSANITYGPLPGKSEMTGHRISNKELMTIDSKTSDFVECQIKKVE